ncbi:hypothetical protein [Novosphingobium beihaiensis]|uniref:Uncharacterized protein n=1 Tax=Novosphingobium beihaiensis TaxID=2930389 RepID=A0ABT0BSY4_9SPHN|nr:hypothetical protein [Novosphingobium beihaiensis]MCJ2188147.1 hypothetical protein [Novosphingobium beihaiensis]
MRFFAALAALAVAGCVSTPTPNYTPVTTAISFPKIGEETEVSLGEDMLRQGFYTETDGIETSQQNNIKGYKLSAGFYPQVSEDKEYTYHSFGHSISRDGSGYLLQATGLLGMPLAFPQSIRASKNKQETCIIVGGLTRPACDTEIPFQRVRRPAISERDLQQTLIYSGRVGDRIKIGYRESSGNMARPAFSNEAEYDLSKSDEIGYRGARIKVLAADNQKIRYIVLSNFNSAK